MFVLLLGTRRSIERFFIVLIDSVGGLQAITLAPRANWIVWILQGSQQSPKFDLDGCFILDNMEGKSGLAFIRWN